MFTQTITLALFASACLVSATPTHVQMHKRQKDNKNDATGTTLLADAIQSGSFSDGSKQGVSAPGQAKSATSKNNFINFCSGKKTITNGLQVLDGSCNGIPMGDIPAKANMVSSVITFPESGGKGPAADTTFDIKVQVDNLVAGFFTNADSTYYSAPQALDGGKIIGHTHVTVQALGDSLNPTKPLDPTQFAFFKGINDTGDGKGLLSATVTGGLPAGNYRVCTMVAARNHQPVLMPVAQRGTPDDCTKFKIEASAEGGNGGKGGNNNGGGAAEGGNGADEEKGDNNNDENAPAVTSSAEAATASKPADGGKDGGRGGKGGGRGGKGGNKNNNGGAEASSTSEAASVATPGATKTTGGNATATSTSTPKPASSTKATEEKPAAASPAASTGNKGGAKGGAVGGIAAPAVTDSGDKARPFKVNGNTFVNEGAAKQRSCDIQFNACMDAFNGGNKAISQEACATQQKACNSA